MQGLSKNDFISCNETLFHSSIPSVFHVIKQVLVEQLKQVELQLSKRNIDLQKQLIIHASSYSIQRLKDQ